MLLKLYLNAVIRKNIIVSVIAKATLGTTKQFRKMRRAGIKPRE